MWYWLTNLLSAALWGTVWLLSAFVALLVAVAVFDIVRTLYRRSRKH